MTTLPEKTDKKLGLVIDLDIISCVLWCLRYALPRGTTNSPTVSHSAHLTTTKSQSIGHLSLGGSLLRTCCPWCVVLVDGGRTDGVVR